MRLTAIRYRIFISEYELPSIGKEVLHIMGNVTLSAAETTVSEQLIAEIDSIGTQSGDVVPSYAPQAWNHEGKVD